MSFLENILGNLASASDRPVLQEARGGQIVGATGGDLLRQVSAARAFARQAGLKPGDRCALLAPNSIRWAALDLALMAEGVIVVPLYARQAPRELAAMIKDSGAALVCCGDAALRDALRREWPAAPPGVLFDEIFAGGGTGSAPPAAPHALAGADPVTIIYTSGTSGEAKGVVLTAGNIGFMLERTGARLDALMGKRTQPDRVFHYLPFCFCGSWILQLTCLSRLCLLTLSTDLDKLADEMCLAAPNYFLNVPALLERMRAGIETGLQNRARLARRLFARAKDAALGGGGAASFFDAVCLWAAKAFMFPAIRRKLGPNLKALICGSAALAPETQAFFQMLGVPVLQVYGLTETTAICTMDIPGRVVGGRVGPALEGAQMKLGENDEILVRGPHIFPGYWNKPQETARVLRDGWFHTGDCGEADAAGNWRISGRLKNLLVLSSGHNIAPEPLEEALLGELPDARQVVLVGDQRSFLAALVTGSVKPEEVDAALERLNAPQPHYKRIHAFHICGEAFTIENGLLTANGKLRRHAIAARFASEIEAMYSRMAT